MISLHQLVADIRSGLLSSESLEKGCRALCSAHVSPDADAVGSSFGFALALSTLGVQAEVYLADPVPPRILALIPPQIKLHSAIPSEEFDAVFALDTATKVRLGKDADAILSLGKKTYDIDHHFSNEGWAEVNYIDSVAPATAFIVWEIISALGVSIDSQLANLLYAGILDDTGSFRFGSTTPEVLLCASDLVRKGAKPDFVSNHLHFTVPRNVVALQGEALRAIEFFHDGKIAMITVPKAMLDRAGAKASDSEGLIEFARQIDGVVAAILQRETDDGWKFSLRSKNSDLDVNQVAAKFNGGGHKMAAGCRLVGTEQEVKKQVIDAFESALKESNLA